MSAERLHDIQSLKDKIGGEATALQDIASNPSHHVWVGASAGTGKTKVLTDRVLRLLLPTQGRDDGTDPSKILCITFTKAGAGEMTARVMKILSHWAVCDDVDLDDELTKLLNEVPSLKQRDKARRLFAQIVDRPENLRITTIHAFCQSVLGRFSLEAGLSPQFKVIEETEANALIKQARDSMIRDIDQGKLSDDICDAFSELATIKNGEQINALIHAILYDRQKIKGLSGYKGILKYLNVEEGETRDTVLTAFFQDYYPANQLKKLCLALAQGANKNQDKGRFLEGFCTYALEEKIRNFDGYRSAFLTSKNEFYADTHISKGAQTYDSQAVKIFFEESVRVKNCVEKLKSIAIAQTTQILLLIAHEIIDRYDRLKKQHNILDYDDLIHCARDLLCGRTQGGRAMKDWVLYKLDGGIDHILVDEAQDTNTDQWDIILKLSEDFFSGESARNDDHPRTLFVVGDEKQSIYRFQGADPQAFQRVKNQIRNATANAQQNFHDVPMNTSFRSVSVVLDMVDAVFSQDALKGSIADNVSHTAHRQGQSGRVELWPVYQTPLPPPREKWQLPTQIIPFFDAKAALANRIADQIASWREDKEMLLSKGRPIDPGDIMILVRRRNIFVDHLIRALKSKNIPVSGVDRMIVTDQIAVQDLLAALLFGLMPDDDLTLATLLKSPLVGWDDEVLEDYAFSRKSTLWEALKDRAPAPLVSWLTSVIEHTSTMSVFEILNGLLIQKVPCKNQTGWQAMVSRLGVDAIDPIEELLSQAQNYDRLNGHLGVQGFVHSMQLNKKVIKREMDDNKGQVKIMTVHAAKGLQAPIVFLPDMCGLPRASGLSDQGFIWANDEVPLWVSSSDNVNDAYGRVRDLIKKDDLDEYYRLLYVAMTRAEDRLIIAGYLPQKNKMPKGSWYEAIKNALSSLPFTENSWGFDGDYCGEDAQSFIFETEQTDQASQKGDSVQKSFEYEPLPDWVHHTIAVEQHPPKILMPSKADMDDVPIRSPLQQGNNDQRFQRGLITHSLLQYLPDLVPERRLEAAKIFMTHQAPDLSEGMKESIIAECLAILNDAQFSPFFGEGSMAEVPVTGVVKNDMTGKTDIISGQIDRMLVTDTDIWIVDYKSNRPPPRDVKDLPKQYRSQMHAYRSLVQQIYPTHKIHTALLWTDGPFMMEIDG